MRSPAVPLLRLHPSRHKGRLALAAVLALGSGWTTAVQAGEPGQEDATERDAEGDEPRLLSRWGREVDADAVWNVYPRPQLVREDWTNLNGLWRYAVRPGDEAAPSTWDGEILVPFPLESALSRVGRRLAPNERLWYRRSFEAAPPADDGRLLLHFGAVDWHAVVRVNGRVVGEHHGGYDPFTLDITGALDDSGEQELVVAVHDPTDTHWQPRGKQVAEPGGIWYTPVSGIWQAVWLEEVPNASVERLVMTPELDPGVLRLRGVGRRTRSSDEVEAVARDDDGVVGKVRGRIGEELELAVEDARPWSPDDPHLYDLEVRLLRDGEQLDRVESYFGLREVEVATDLDGHRRIFLNGEPLFGLGPLDQGWWPDGLYLAPSDEALRYDLEVTKRLGFNTVRKHVKVEPARWYYHCDRLGLLVWQDMPNGDRHIGGDDPDLERSPSSAAGYRRELRAMIRYLRSHPSIIVWVPFNEGWGQFETDAILAEVKELDPSRLVDGPSGWADRGSGDLRDTHRYPGPGMPEPEEERAVVLGEFGGLGLPVEGHLWQDRENWGYRTYESREELRAAYRGLIRELRPLISRGLAAAIYTQTTDVEGEVNGLMTYDREVLKFDPEAMARLHAPLYEPPPIVDTRVVVPTSEAEGRTWRLTKEEPPEGWESADFDDSAWREARGGFGTEGTPGAVVRTEWDGERIWLRRRFRLDEVPERPWVRIHHDEDARVWINGVEVASFGGYTTGYEDRPLADAAGEALRAGENVLAVTCEQTGGGQYIDVGLLDVEITPREEAER